MSKVTRVYVGQYDATWSMKPSDWQRFLQNGAAGQEMDLDHYGRRVKRAPAWVEVHRTLDWTQEDFAAELTR